MLHIKIHQFYVKKRALNLLRVYRKSTTSAQTDGRIATDGSLYTGISKKKQKATGNLIGNKIYQSNYQLPSAVF